MLRAIIIDDEQKAIESLKAVLGMVNVPVKVLAEGSSVMEAIQLIEETSFDVLFLDISLKDGLGMDVLRRFQGSEFFTVFVTAYNNYAIQAVKLHAFDYLLKPINPVELENTLERIRTGLKDRSQGKRSGFNSRISIPTLKGLKIVSVEDILRVEADSNYSRVHFREGKPLIVSKTLKSFESNLDPEVFIRVHQSHIVQFDSIAEYSKREMGSILLKNEETIPVGRSFKSAVETAIEQRTNRIN